MSGVTRVKWPVTVTVTRFAGEPPVAQDGAQTAVTSPVPTVTNEPLASLVAAHITRFVELHALPDENDVGWYDASTAPARAAFVTVICE